MPREIPPTAGLPLQLGDLYGRSEDLATVLARQLATPSVQLACSGTAAFLVALETLRRREPRRSRVVLPAYTCPLMALAVRQAGLDLVLCDLRPDHFDLDHHELARLCDARTLAIVPTHLGGRIADVDGAVAIARKVGAFVIEDAAQALGARQHGRSVGLAGDVGIFSLAAGKGLTTYEGGVLVAQSADLRRELAEVAAHIRQHRGWEVRRAIELFGYWALYRPLGLHYVYGRPLRAALRRGDPVAAVGDDFSARIPLHRLGQWRQRVAARASRRWPAFLADNTARAQSRCARLRSLGLMVLGDRGIDSAGTWPVLMLLMPDQAARDRALAALWQRGIGVSRMFVYALPDYAVLQDWVADGPLPCARDFATRMLTISNSAWLDDDGFDAICAALVRALTAAAD